MAKHDVVYVLKNNYTDEELRYSVRSVVQNFQYRKLVFEGHTQLRSSHSIPDQPSESSGDLREARLGYVPIILWKLLRDRVQIYEGCQGLRSGDHS